MHTESFKFCRSSMSFKRFSAIVLSLCVLLLSGCKDQFDKIEYQLAKRALQQGEIQTAGQLLLSGLKREFGYGADTQIAHFSDNTTDLKAPHPAIEECQSQACRQALKQYAEAKKAELANENISNFNFEQFSAVSKLIHQSEKGIHLASCIIMDTLNLFQRSLGPSSKPYIDELKKVFLQINALEAAQLTPQGAESLYRLAKARGEKAASVKNCRQASLAYNEFKKEVANYFSQVQLPNGTNLDEVSQRTFYHSMLSKRYHNILNQHLKE